jgi:hypothetical protein
VCLTRDLPDNRLVIVAKQGYAVHKKHVIWGRSDHALSALTLLFGVRIFLSYQATLAMPGLCTLSLVRTCAWS